MSIFNIYNIYIERDCRFLTPHRSMYAHYEPEIETLVIY